MPLHEVNAALFGAFPGGEKGILDLELRSPGIYAIVHVATGRLYIGSAVAIDRRWYEHRKTLRASRHHNRKLQNAWNKHGEEAFELRVVMPVEHIHDLIGWEQFWIDKLAPHYNLAPKAGSQLGLRHTAEARKRMSEAQLAVDRKPDWHAAMVSAARERMQSEDWLRQRGDKVAAAVAQTYQFVSPDGEQVIVTNLARFCREHGLVENRMREVWRGIRLKKHHGWTKGGQGA